MQWKRVSLADTAPSSTNGKTEFIKQLRMTAEELKLLTEAVTVGSSVWNGSEYVKAAKESICSCLEDNVVRDCGVARRSGNTPLR
jgi:hypothetical protein